MPRRTFHAFDAALVCLATIALAAAAKEAPGEEPIRFSRDILPILSDNCFHCHGSSESGRQADLRLDVEELAKADRGGTRAIEPSNSAKSLIIERMTSSDPELVMPPPKSNRKVTPAQVELVKKWIDQGATWGTHWAFERIERPGVPSVAATTSLRNNAIDNFVQAKLTSIGQSAAAEAPRHTLIRRVTLDLTGLPPSVEEVEAFENDPSPEAYAKLVERLLASPRVGERLAWDWLDAARYADSNGYQGDGERTMSPWRDWVVDAFNRDLPYDTFTKYQLAGDLLPSATFEQKLATGFCRNHMINGEGGRIPEENRVDYVMDMTETMGTLWMGLTLTCCRCHDHKYDPTLQKEYYGLFAFFNQTPVNGGDGNPQAAPNLEAAPQALRDDIAKAATAIDPLVNELDQTEQKLFPRPEGQSSGESSAVVDVSDEVRNALKKHPRDRDSAALQQIEAHYQKQESTADFKPYVAQLQTLRAARDRHTQLVQRIPRVMVMEDMKEPRKTFRLDKGLYNKTLDEVSIGTPAKLPPMDPQVAKNRLSLAEWLVSREHPLTARVTVNRVWQQFFGIGLVKTTEDFGLQAERPSHPELLDWLAAELIDSGWDMKELVRLIVTSHTYRQTSQVGMAAYESDPQNRLLARGARYRWPSWLIRDQALAASGLLVDEIGGRPVNTYQPAGIWEEATFGGKQYSQDHGAKLYRRSLYTFWRRIVGPTMFFDNSPRQVCSVKIFRTNTPLHSLLTLNDVQHIEAARALAQRVLKESPADDNARIDRLYKIVLARGPAADERSILLSGLTRARETFAKNPEAEKTLLSVGESPRDQSIPATDHAAWTTVCNTVLNLDETLSKE